MSETITVFTEADALDDAYQMGYSRYESMTAADIAAAGPIHPTEHDAWDTHILSSLRAVAGFDDMGVGTYNMIQEIAVIETGDESDSPATAQKMEAYMFLDTVIDNWRAGAFDAMKETMEEADGYSTEQIYE
jgi:hypothetical protein